MNRPSPQDQLGLTPVVTYRLRAWRIAAVVAVFGVLAGCASSGKPSDNTDPRKGRVTTEWSNCATGACLWSWKVCIGPDLIVHIDGVEHDHTIHNSRECTP